jgi:hypothetical protein
MRSISWRLLSTPSDSWMVIRMLDGSSLLGYCLSSCGDLILLPLRSRLLSFSFDNYVLLSVLIGDFCATKLFL